MRDVLPCKCFVVPLYLICRNYWGKFINGVIGRNRQNDNGHKHESNKLVKTNLRCLCLQFLTFLNHNEDCNSFQILSYLSYFDNSFLNFMLFGVYSGEKLAGKNTNLEMLRPERDQHVCNLFIYLFLGFCFFFFTCICTTMCVLLSGMGVIPKRTKRSSKQRWSREMNGVLRQSILLLPRRFLHCEHQNFVSFCKLSSWCIFCSRVIVSFPRAERQKF